MSPAVATPSPPVRLPAARPPRGRLELLNIGKQFAGGPVIDDVTVACKPGEFVVMVGPSGCGKSTMLNIAAGMLKPDAGRVLLDGFPVVAPGPRLAVVFQEHGLFPWLNARDNIGFGLKMARMPRSEREDRVEAALKMVHLTHAATKLVHELSGGMRQRVAIARALVMDPAVLLLDEPFAALDAQTRTLLHSQLQNLWVQTHKTVLFVTHSVGEAVRLADRIIVMHAHPGRIRREIAVNLSHPRDFDSPAITDLVRLVRTEIQDEVNRVNAMAPDVDSLGAPARVLADAALDLGDGI